MNGHKYPRKWEVVNGQVSRLELPDGWLLLISEKVIYGDKQVQMKVTSQIYHDPGHRWVLEP